MKNIIKDLYHRGLKRLGMKVPTVKPEENAKPVEKDRVLPLDPPFLDENGKYDSARAKEWQRLKLRPRWFHKSKFHPVNRNGEQESGWTSETYVRPKVAGQIKGKLAIKRAKRQRVAEMKARQI